MSIEQMLFCLAIAIFCFAAWYMLREHLAHPREYALDCGCTIVVPPGKDLKRWGMESGRLKSFRGELSCTSCHERIGAADV